MIATDFLLTAGTARPADARADDLEYGTDGLGAAIDDWIDGDDLEDIE